MRYNTRLLLEIIGFILIIGLFCCSQAKADTEHEAQNKLLFVAQKALEDGFYDVSLGYLERFLKEFPQTEKRAKVYLLMGQCYLHQNKYVNAIDIFDKILELSNIEGVRDDVYFWKAEVYFRAKDYSHAKKFYREILSNFPKSEYATDATYSLAWSSFEEGDYEQAINGFNKLIELYPKSELIEDAYFKIAESLYNQKKYQEAKDKFSIFIKNFPRSIKKEQAYFFRAESDYYLKDYFSAIKDYEEVNRITKDNKLLILSKVGIGWSYLMLKKFTDSEDVFNEVIELARDKNIGLDNALLGKATLFSELGKEQEALSVYEELISEFPDSSLILDAYLGRANSFYKQSKYKEALEAYQEVLSKLAWSEEFSDLQEKAYFGLAWTNLKLERINEAIKEFQNIIDRTSDKIVKISALSQLGNVYQEIGEFQKAVDIYDKILKDYPDSFYSDYVQYQLAVTLLKMKNIDASILAFQSLKLNYPKSKFILDSEYYLGLAYFNKGNFITAKEQLQNFINNVSHSHELRPQAMHLLGLVYRQIGDFKESSDIFKVLIKEYSSNEEIVMSAKYEFAISLFYLGKDKEGLKQLKLLSYNYPHTKVAEDALFYIANYYLSQKEFDTSIRYFQKLVTEYPDTESIDAAYYGIGQSYFEKNKFDEAIKNFNLIRAMPYSKFYGPATLAIADAYTENNDINSAIKILKDLTDSHPEFSREALVRIGDYFRSLSKYDEAKEAYRQGLSKKKGVSDLDDAQIYFKIAELFEEKKDLNKAIEAYLKVAYLSPQHDPMMVKAYLRAARIFEDRESWQEAKRIYEKIANEDVDEAKFAKERLEWIKNNIKN
jgi:TolA-binding protein